MNNYLLIFNLICFFISSSCDALPNSKMAEGNHFQRGLKRVRVEDTSNDVADKRRKFDDRTIQKTALAGVTKLSGVIPAGIDQDRGWLSSPAVLSAFARMEKDYFSSLDKASKTTIFGDMDQDRDWLSSGEVLSAMTQIEREHSASSGKASQTTILGDMDQDRDWLSSGEVLSAIKRIEESYSSSPDKASKTMILEDMDQDRDWLNSGEVLSAMTQIEREHSASSDKASKTMILEDMDQDRDWLSSGEVLSAMTQIEREHSASSGKASKTMILEDMDQDRDWLNSGEVLSAMTQIEREHSASSGKALEATQSTDEIVIESLSQKFSSPSQSPTYDDFPIHPLKSFKSHYQHLIHSIRSAKRNIIIASYNFSATLKDEFELFDELRKASLRNVRVQIYFNQSKLSEGATKWLTESRVELTLLKVHSKILAVDDEVLTCGSFNWLGSHHFLRRQKDSSIVLKGKFVRQLIGNIEERICTYRTLSLNPRITRSIEEKFQKLRSLPLPLGEEAQVELLTTPQQHDRFFKESFGRAQHEIALYVPFVTNKNDRLHEILPLSTVKSFLNAGKKLTIFHDSDNQHITILQEYLRGLECSGLVFYPTVDLHRKSLCIDGATYVEGSYNWFSSARDILEPHYFMETSIVLKGQGFRALMNNLMDI